MDDITPASIDPARCALWFHSMNRPPISRATVAILGGVTAGVLLLLGSLYVLHRVRGTSVLRLLRDPAGQMGDPFLGAISQLGILGWATAASVCIFTGAALNRTSSGAEQRRFLLGMGVLTGVLCLDDLYLIHETIGPQYLGLPEEVLFGAYGLGAAALLVHFRRTVWSTDVYLLAAALLAFAASIVVDLTELVLLFATITEQVLVEDTAKLIGIFLWAAYLIRTADAAVGETHQRRSSGTPTSAPPSRTGTAMDPLPTNPSLS